MTKRRKAVRRRLYGTSTPPEPEKPEFKVASECLNKFGMSMDEVISAIRNLSETLSPAQPPDRFFEIDSAAALVADEQRRNPRTRHADFSVGFDYSATETRVMANYVTQSQADAPYEEIRRRTAEEIRRRTAEGMQNIMSEEMRNILDNTGIRTGRWRSNYPAIQCPAYETFEETLHKEFEDMPAAEFYQKPAFDNFAAKLLVERLMNTDTDNPASKITIDRLAERQAVRVSIELSGPELEQSSSNIELMRNAQLNEQNSKALLKKLYYLVRSPEVFTKLSLNADTLNLLDAIANQLTLKSIADKPIDIQSIVSDPPKAGKRRLNVRKKSD